MCFEGWFLQDKDDILADALAEELAVDSVSDDDEETEQLSRKQLLNLLVADPAENEDEFSHEMFWSSDMSTFQGTKKEFSEEAGPKI